eukprot:GCRY01001112.1.p1 GENE.GCRY01001112.1~~GCRY01001112.1.p1  ORF type:complete len:228 (-),score=46.88 GCRY01001112.1:124-711(-)
MKLLGALICVLVLLGTAFAEFEEEEQKRAFLLVHKVFETEQPVTGSDLIVRYDIYNIGNEVATEVSLEDDSWPLDEFDRIEGLPSKKWGRIDAGEKVNLTFTLKPTVEGLFKTAPAVVLYKPTPDAELPITVTSTDDVYIYMVSNEDWERMNDMHLCDWSIFGAMTLFPIGLPALIYFFYSSRYENGIRKEKKTQ